MSDFQTYEQFTKDWSLSQKIKFYYEVDINNSEDDIQEVIHHISHDATRIQQFEEKFKQYLIEREYIDE